MHYFGATSNEMYHNTVTGLKSYFLTFGDGARLEIMTRPGVEDCNNGAYRAGYAHLAVAVGNKECVDRLTGKLKADGFNVVSGPRTTGDGYYESCIEGPEGNLIEITV